MVLNLLSLADGRRRGDMITTHKSITEVDGVPVNIWFERAADQVREGATHTRHKTGTRTITLERSTVRHMFFQTNPKG